jgi:hypothetical protein
MDDVRDPKVVAALIRTVLTSAMCRRQASCWALAAEPSAHSCLHRILDWPGWLSVVVSST